MTGYGFSRRELVQRGETMNRLKDRQHTLNMRLLLAVQTRDTELQAELERRLEEVLEEMHRLNGG